MCIRDSYLRHPGQEFALVLSGKVRIQFENGDSVVLNRLESAYFDSGIGHVYLSLSKKPVSYTHLDVYKRQPDFLPVLESNPAITLNTSVATQGMAIVNALHPPFDKPQARQALYYLFSQKEMLAAIGYPEKYRVDYCATLYLSLIHI